MFCAMSWFCDGCACCKRTPRRSFPRPLTGGVRFFGFFDDEAGEGVLFLNFLDEEAGEGS